MNRDVPRGAWIAPLLGCCLVITFALGACSGSPASVHVSNRALTTSSDTQAQANASATAATSGPQLTLPVSSLMLTSSSHLDFSGSGFAPGATLDIRVENAHAATELRLPPAKVDASGNLPPESVVLPAGLAPGEHWLVAKDEASSDVARAVLQVQRVPPTVQLDTYAAAPGYSFGVSGQGFVPSESVRVFLGTIKGAPIATLRAGPAGSLVGRVRVPALAAGKYTLSFVGRASVTPVSVVFDVQAFKPWVVLTNYAPKAGATVVASGWDFAPNEPVYVYLNAATGQPETTITADPLGSFTNASVFVVPDSLSGQQTLIFVGARSQVQTSAPLDVLS
jgi:hypothetical protein